MQQRIELPQPTDILVLRIHTHFFELLRNSSWVKL